jgi:alpha-1,6-mannosyltransferase
VLATAEVERRAAARARAEQFTWPAAVDGMLAALRAC